MHPVSMSTFEECLQYISQCTYQYVNSIRCQKLVDILTKTRKAQTLRSWSFLLPTCFLKGALRFFSNWSSNLSRKTGTLLRKPLSVTVFGIWCQKLVVILRKRPETWIARLRRFLLAWFPRVSLWVRAWAATRRRIFWRLESVVTWAEELMNQGTRLRANVPRGHTVLHVCQHPDGVGFRVAFRISFAEFWRRGVFLQSKLQGKSKKLNIRGQHFSCYSSKQKIWEPTLDSLTGVSSFKFHSIPTALYFALDLEYARTYKWYRRTEASISTNENTKGRQNRAFPRK